MSEDSIEMLVVTLLFDGDHTESGQLSRPTRSASEQLTGPQSSALCSKKNRGDVLCRSVLSLSFDVVVALLFDGESTPNPISRAVPHEAHRNN